MSDKDDSPAPIEAEGSGDPEGHCYCNKPREIGTVELQCMSCLKWFHRDCIELGDQDTGPLIPFMNAYNFHCKKCSPTECEGFLKKAATFVQMLQSTIANLLWQNREQGATHFSKEKEIIPFIEANWEALTGSQRRTKSTWHATVTKTLGQNPSVFSSQPSSEGSGNCFGMHDSDVSAISPNYEKLAAANAAANSNSNNKSKGVKRKIGGNSAGDSKRSKTDGVPKLPSHGYPLDHPFNKDEWTYIFSELDPFAEKDDDDENDFTPKPIPPHQYRKVFSKQVYLSMHDRAPQLKMTEDRLTITGEKGYSLVKATHHVHMGCYYFEITVNDMPEGSACRLGWALECANNQAPLGYDSFGYSYRSRKGTRFHKSIGKHYGDAYTQGDVIGFLINLPKKQYSLPDSYKDKPLVKFKSFLYFEVKRNAKAEEAKLKPFDGSYIEFFKNGKSQGKAFENIHCGNYIPAASLYKNCCVSFNFGPEFKFPPDLVDTNYQPMSERTISECSEQILSDFLYLVETDQFMKNESTPFVC